MKMKFLCGLPVAVFALLGLGGMAHAQADTVYWPVSGSATEDPVDKPFGFRVLCGACTDPDDADFHRGLDFKFSKGTRVYAVFDGDVVRIRHTEATDTLSRWGRFIVIALDEIEKADGTTLSNHKVAYLHLDEVDSSLAVGSSITRGQYLGKIGNSGQGINTNHLHFNYYQGSSDPWIRRAEARNPLELFGVASIVPTVGLAKTSDSTLRLTVTQDPDSLDIVGFRLDHDGWSSFHGTDPIEIDFNEKDGINMTAPEYEDLNPFEGTTFLPKYFNKNSTSYRLYLDFDGDWSDASAFTVTLTNVHDVDYTYTFDL